MIPGFYFVQCGGNVISTTVISTTVFIVVVKTGCGGNDIVRAKQQIILVYNTEKFM